MLLPVSYYTSSPTLPCYAPHHTACGGSRQKQAIRQYPSRGEPTNPARVSPPLCTHSWSCPVTDRRLDQIAPDVIAECCDEAIRVGQRLQPTGRVVGVIRFAGRICGADDAVEGVVQECRGMGEGIGY